MDLKELGFDPWFHERQKKPPRPDCRVARVTAVNRDRHLVRNESREVLAEVAGSLRFSAESAVDLPCVGDWTFVQYCNADTFAIIHSVFPRKSALKRKAAGRDIDYQMIAANIDVT